MNGYDRATFGQPREEVDKQYTFLSYKSESDRNLFNRNQSREDMIKERHSAKGRGTNKQVMITKLNNISEQLYEVIFLKESVMSMVGEQRVKMGDFMREIKKYLFQLGMKAERESISKISKLSNENSQMEYNEGSSRFIPNGDIELQRVCEQLMKENDMLKEKYEQMLLHYRSEIENLSNSLPRTQEQTVYNNPQIRQLKQIAFESQQKLKQEQARFAERVRYLQSQILALQDQYLKEKEGYQRQLDQYRAKERQIAFHESEIQRKNILLIERQKQLTQREITTKQQRNALERRQTKISDYQHNQFRREKQKAEIQKQTLRSEYYVSYDRIPEPRQHTNRFNIDTKSQRQKSSGNRLVNSRVDINARLREIQMERKGAHGGIKNSRMSQAGGLRGQRSSSRSKNQLLSFGYQPSRKEVPPQNVNMKLETMLQSLQRDLSDMK